MAHERTRPTHSAARWIILAALLALPTACSDDTEYSGDDGALDGSPVPLESFCAQASQTFASIATRCMLPGFELEFEEADCRDNLLKSIEGGFVNYDDALMGTCLKSLESTCDIFVEIDACTQAITGTLGDGEVCYQSQECKDGYCATWNGSEDVCPGSCITDAAIGESCDERDCDRGAFCNDMQVCQALLAVGEACQGYGCVREAQCDRESQVCVTSPPRAAVGQTCNDSIACDLGLFCLSASDATREDGVCTAPKALGESCPTGGADFSWVFQGCINSICVASAGAETGTCTAANNGDACVEIIYGSGENSYSLFECVDGQCNDDTKLCEAYADENCNRP